MDIVSILLSLLGFTIFSTGIVLTKAGGAWTKWTGKKSSAFYKSIGIWILGFILYNSGAIPNAIASQSLPPHIISAISGWGITVIVLLSFLLLKEKLYVSDFIFSFTMIAGIFFLSLLDQTAKTSTIDQTAFYILLAIPIVLIIPGLIGKIGRKPQTIILSIVAGSAGGFGLVIMNVVVKSLGFDIFSYFDTPYPYLYLVCGVLQFVALQLAMRHGTMIEIGPLQNALMILYPVACSYFIFGANLGIIQLGMIAVIVFSCVMILRKH